MDLAPRLAALNSVKLDELRALVLDLVNDSELDLKIPSAKSLAVYASVLQANVLLTFAASDEAQTLLSTLFHSFAGVSCLVSRLQTSKDVESRAVFRLLDNICRDRLLIAACIEHSGAKPLFFGSRLLNVAAASSAAPRDSPLCSVDTYSEWLAGQMIDARLKDAQLLDRGIKLGAPRALISTFLARDLPLFAENYEHLLPAQRMFALGHLLSALAPDLTSAARQLISINPDITETVQAAVRGGAEQRVIRALVVHARFNRALPDLARAAFRIWGSDTNAPLSKQQTLTQILVACAPALDETIASELSMCADLMNGVSARLESANSQMRKIATLVAELYAKQGGKDLSFMETYDEFPWWIGIDEVPNVTSIKTAENRNLLARDDHESTRALNRSQAEPLDKLAAVLHPLPPAEAEDSDDEFDSDDEDHTSAPPPFYIKDLTDYLIKGEYPEVHAALTYGPELVLRKASFGSEVAQYAEELLRAACILADKWNIPQFAERRQALLNAVVIADPQQAKTVVHMFSTGDWSLPQRLGLLAALASGASVLSGCASQSMESAPAVRQVLAPELPPAQHILFQGRGLLGTDLEVGKVPVRPSFARICSIFFFPLIHSPPRLGAASYDALVYSQWLRTLGAILFAAYPTNRMSEMVGELWPLCCSLLSFNRTVPELVRESAAWCVAAMASVAGAVLMRDFPSEIGKCHDSMLEICSDAQEERLLIAARQAASELATLGASLEEKLLGYRVN